MADILLEILERRAQVAVLIDPAFPPARPFGDKEGLAVRALVLQQLIDRVLIEVLILPAYLFALFVELVRHALYEEHAEYVLLELGCIHFATKDVRGFKRAAGIATLYAAENG